MANSIDRIGALARLVVIDGLKRNALVWLILFSLAGQVSGLVFFDFIPRDISRAANDYLFSVNFIAGLAFLLFHAVQALAWDDKHQTVHVFLSRPISRTEYVLGMFWGLSILVLFLNIVLGITGWSILLVIKKNVKTIYFQNFSTSLYILTVAGIIFIELIILAVVNLFSCLVRGNFPVLLMTLAYLGICNGLPIVRESCSHNVDKFSGSVFSVILKLLAAVFPDLSRLDFKSLVMDSIEFPPFNDLFLVFSSSFFYIVVLLWFATFLFNKRDVM